MIRQNGDLLVNLIEIKNDRCIIDWSFVLGHREPYNGMGVLGQAMPHRWLEQRTIHKLGAHARIKNTKYPGVPGIPTHPRITDNNAPQEHNDPSQPTALQQDSHLTPNNSKADGRHDDSTNK